MEGNLREALQKALNLTSLQAVIVASNVQLRDKIYILRTSLHLTTALSKKQSDHFNRVLINISEYSHKRNMIAHDEFMDDKKGDGVSFMAIKAKGKLKLPQEDWSIADFEEAYVTIDGFAKEIAKLTKALDGDALADALMGEGAISTLGGLFGQGFGGLLYPPAQGTLLSDIGLASPKKEPQTPPSSEE